jgi:hypothetical protein
MTDIDKVEIRVVQDICKALDAAREAGEGPYIVPFTLEKIVVTVLLVMMEPGCDDEIADALGRHVKKALREARPHGDALFKGALH